MKPLQARGVGEPGFTAYVKQLQRHGVLSREEVRGFLALHGAVLRSSGLPLDRGDGVPDELLDRLRAEFGP